MFLFQLGFRQRKYAGHCIFLTLDNLHVAIPNFRDYFTYQEYSFSSLIMKLNFEQVQRWQTRKSGRSALLPSNGP